MKLNLNTVFTCIVLIRFTACHNPVCRQETRHISPKVYVDNLICKSKSLVHEITRKVCPGNSKCFDCSSKNLKIVAESIPVHSCRKNIPDVVDRHLRISACNELTKTENWNMCLDPSSFLGAYCPVLKAQNFKKGEALCCRDSLKKRSLGCMTKYEEVKSTPILIRQKNGIWSKFLLRHSSKISCCTTLR